jgi:lysylphosphatidylglycerol synthetase-like protein (DUF2156 family)
MIKQNNRPFYSDVELVRRYGGPVSHAALNPSLSLFRIPDIDGLIGFQLVQRCAVVQGDPVCASEYKSALADAFASYCTNKGWGFLYTSVTADMKDYAKKGNHTMMEFAGFLIADPQDDPEIGHQGHHLRQHLNNTRRSGVSVIEYWGETNPNMQVEAQIAATCKQWLKARHGLQMYLGHPRLFDDRHGRRWFIAEYNGRVIGMLSMLKIGCFECDYLINLVFSSPIAPLYTNELLIVTALQALRKEDVKTVCLGVGPLEILGKIEGSDGFTEFLSRKLYQLASRILNLKGRSECWNKFHITRREPMYLVFQSSRIGLREIIALFRALNCSIT